MNQLGVIMKMQGLQNEMQANRLQAQKYQQEIATSQETERKTRLEAKRDAFQRGAAMAGDNPELLMGLLTKASQDPDLSEYLGGIGPQHLQFISSQLNDPAKVKMLANRMRGMSPKDEAELAKPQTTLGKLQAELAQLSPDDPRRAAYKAAINKETRFAPTEASQLPADVQTVQWLMTQPKDVQDMYFKAKQQLPGYSFQVTDQGLVAVNTKDPADAQLVTLPGATSGAAPGAVPGISPTNALGTTPAATPAAPPDAAFGGRTPLKPAKTKEATAAEQRDTFAIRQVLSNAQLLTDALANDPSALQPSLIEAAVSNTPVISGLTGATQSASRQVIAASFRDILDSALYLATGAAYNREQLAGKLEALVPAYLDKPDAIAAKKQRVLNTIADAKARSGKLWTPELENSFNTLVTAMFPSKNAGGAPAGGAPTGRQPLGAFD